MLSSLFDLVLWIYWKLNKPFIAAFSVAMLGAGEGVFKPDGKRIANRIESFLRGVNRTVFILFLSTIATLPLAVPRALPREGLRRILVTLWYALRSNVARWLFLFRRRARQVSIVEKMFHRLCEEAPEQVEEMIKTIVTVTQLKTVITMAYLEQEDLWAALGYKPTGVSQPVPPSGPDLVRPPPTRGAELLHNKRKTPRQVAKKPAGVRTYCVIGSGAGGANAAHVIKQSDREARVIMLECGPLMTNDMLKPAFLDAAASVYMNGAVTLSQDLLFTFRQARCVGGGTLVNNSIAIKPQGFWWDKNIVERWSWEGAKLDYNALQAAYGDILKRLNVHEVDDYLITDAARMMRTGFESEKDPIISKIGKAPCNVLDCIGCGRCNMGCAFDAKQSMINTMIPEFVAAGGLLVPDAKADRLHFEDMGGGRQRVRAVEVIGREGKTVVEADRFVLSSGAYASSKLLWRSGFKGAVPGVRTVGRRFSVNLGTPVIGVFSKPTNPFAGQQLGFLIEVPDQSMVIETATAPPEIIGISVPHWGRQFQGMVHRMNSMACAVPVLSSSSYGQVRRFILGESGFALDFTMTDEDYRRLSTGMKLAARAMFAMGAQEVFVQRFDARSITSYAEAEEYFDAIGPATFLTVQSAHLQGGNVISDKAYRGVVDAQLKVHGFDNLWICDASAFPAPIGVNIAMTVMALARYGARFVVEA